MTRRLAIRWRLTLWQAALLALALALLSGSLYVGLRRALYDSLDNTLRGHAALILSAVEIQQGEPSLGGASLTSPREGEQFIRLTDRAGRVIVDTSGSMDQRPLDQAGLQLALVGQTDLRWITADGERMRVLSAPVLAGGVIVGAFQVGLFASDVTDTLRTTLGLMAVLDPVVLLVAAGSGAWLARRALNPLERIAALAEEIEAHDLTMRIDLELPDDEVGRVARTFNAMLERIELAFQRQRQFTADASHELRTPLALLQSQIELARAAPRNPVEDTLVLASLAEDVERMARISNALLALALGDARRIHIERDAVDLAALLALVAEQYAAPAEAAGITLVVDSQPARIWADEDKLIQVLTNVLDNALRYTPPGRRILLGCCIEGQLARIWVTDEGSGIAPEHLPRLFDRFYRAEPGRSRAHGGVGIGLSICKLLIEAHGGGIQIESAPGVGTTVTVTLPTGAGSPPAGDADRRGAVPDRARARGQRRV